MSEIDHSVATLHFSGDDLIPERISELLGAAPTQACVKDQEVHSRSTGKTLVARTGRWQLKAERREPEDLEAQIFELLDKLSGDLKVWISLSRYKPRLFCGIFMGSSNDVLQLSAGALLALGQRGVALGLDIYDVDDEERNS